MSIPINAPLSLRQGETLGDLLFVLQNPDGTAYNLTSCSAHLSARQYATDTTPVIDLSTSNGGIVINAMTGTIQPVISPATTYALTPQNLMYDLFVTFANGDRFAVFAGGLSIIAANTVNP